LGVTHAELGAYLIGIWGLPDLVVESVAFHHKPGYLAGLGLNPLMALSISDWIIHQKTDGNVVNSSDQQDMATNFRDRMGTKLDNWCSIGEEVIQRASNPSAIQ
jgi:HD-like signal output (HDOD) protein